MTRTTEAPQGSFPLPAFEHRLWEELAHLHADRPAPERPRRRAYRLTAAGLAAAACVAVGVVVADQRGDGTTTGPAEVATTAPDPVPIGDDAIVVIRRDGETTWRDEATGAIRTSTAESDQVLRHYESAREPRGSRWGIADQALVDHESRTYWVRPEAPAGEWVDVPGREADWIAGEIEQGSLTADGREVVDGRELLRYVGPPATTTELCGIPGDPRGFTEDQCDDPGVERDTVTTVQRVVWVDPGTGRPVRRSGDDDHDGAVDTTTFEYLPRTPENLELLEVVVPEGYTEVAPDESHDGVTLER